MFRPLLLLLFFTINHFSCGGNARLIGCLEIEIEALIDFKNGLEDPENRLSSWKGSNCCQWRGIHCHNTTGAVLTVDLHNPHPQDPFGSPSRYGFWNLSGEISPSLKMLESLKRLDLSFNTFNGIPIPEFFESLKNLQYLNLSHAGFRGRILPNLGNLSSLQFLDVSSNSLYVSSNSLSVDNLEWLTGIVSMEYLNMNGANLSMVGPDWIAKLNKLLFLTELHMSSCGLSGFIPSLTVVNFTSLSVVELDSNSFKSEIPNWLVNISNLETLSMRRCGLHGRIPLGFGKLLRLKSINLSLNENLTASCSELFRGGWEKIEVIDLYSSQLHGKLPASFGNMTALTYFDLSYNNVEGGIPSSIGELCNLKFFRLSGNNLTGTLPEVLGMRTCKTSSPLPSLQHLDLSTNRLVGKLPEWLGQLENLIELNLFDNSLYGPIPSTLGSLTNISRLHLGYNKLNGTLPDSLGKLSELSMLDVSSNHLTGVVTETHFSQLSKLRILRLYSNSLTLNISSDWIPRFQVWVLDLESCHLGPSFPAWIRSQKEVGILNFSNASISGSIPNWFWEISSHLAQLNISFNQLGGQVPNPFNASPGAFVDLSSNFFEGPIPFPNVDIELLDLSNNVFSGHIPKAIGETIPSMIFLSLSGNQLTGEIPASIGENLLLEVINFSNNRLNGSIPPTIANCSVLKALDLSKNNLSGNIPSSLGQLHLLQTLHLSDNKLSGQLPQALQNLSSLETLDIGNNMLTGSIPSWIGKGFEYLRILRLRSNEFFGELPIMLSNLSSLHVLDLAENQLNGSIPTSLGDFKAMAQVQNTNRYLRYGYNTMTYYEESLVVNLKGLTQKYTKILSLVISIDLSANKLSGYLPEEITKLAGLIALDLSRNRISGHILEGISKLKQLQSLDLSSNKLSGPIPQSLSSLSFLGYLNLSNNEFSGRIPYTGHLTTFDAPSFAGNPGLCGAPLVVSCLDDDPNKGKTLNDDDDDGNDFIDKWFYLSVGLGFASGILVPFFILAIRKSWSDAYFRLADQVLERISECHA